MGLRRLRKEYTPMPYSRKTETQQHVPMASIADAAATYLQEQHWSSHNDPAPYPNTYRLAADNLAYDDTPFDMPELQVVLFKLKKRKAPGPD
eukprot:7496678-Prorocentrum_lima.AAC.1